jgi:hypothetical protein
MIVGIKARVFTASTEHVQLSADYAVGDFLDLVAMRQDARREKAEEIADAIDDLAAEHEAAGHPAASTLTAVARNLRTHGMPKR